MREIAVVIGLALVAGTVSGRTIIRCSDLISTSFGTEVKISSAVIVPAVAGVPEHCDVRGTIWPEARLSGRRPDLR